MKMGISATMRESMRVGNQERQEESQERKGNRKMKQTKKITINTVVKQQEEILKKLVREREDLELALEDKMEQIELQEKVLETLRGDK